MKYNFNDHTDGDNGALPNPRPTWAAGIARAGDDWKLRRNKGTAAELYRDGTWTQTGYDSSPVFWAWTGLEDEMDVGFYVSTSGAVGQVELYRSDGSFVTNCSTQQDVAYARVKLNKNQIDGTPGWFFESVVRHELGHVFGLCHAQGETTASDYKKSVMFAPHAADLMGTGGCYGTFYDSKYHCESLSPTSTSANNTPWPQYAPWTATATTSDPDYGSRDCPTTGQLAGTRCVYRW